MGVAFKKTCISDKIILIILISFQNITNKVFWALYKNL